MTSATSGAFKRSWNHTKSSVLPPRLIYKTHGMVVKATFIGFLGSKYANKKRSKADPLFD